MSLSQVLSSKTFLRVLFSAVLLVFLLAVLDFPALWKVLTRMSLPGAIAISLLYALGQTLSAWKWSFIVADTPLSTKALTLIRAYFFGMFVNTFGLGTIGGDLTRALLLRPAKQQRSLAISTVVADRVYGLLVLAVIGCLGVFLVGPEPLDTPLLRSAACGAAVLILLALVFLPSLKGRENARRSSRMQKLREVLSSLILKRSTLLKVSAVSVLVHALQIGMHFVIAKDLHTGLSLLFLIAVVPIVNIASSLPFSINGIGVRESLYLLFFVPLGVSAEVAVAFGAIWLVSVTLVSALGGLFLPPELRRELKEVQWPEGEHEPRRRVA